MSSTGRVAASFVAAGLYAASLALPAFRSPLRESDLVYPGWDALLIGWRALVVPAPLDWDLDRAVLCAGAAANPAIWAAALCLAVGFPRWAVGLASLGLAGQVAVASRYWLLVAGYPGFWCWVACAGLLVVAAWRSRAEQVAAADGGRDLGLAEFLVAQRGRRG